MLENDLDVELDTGEEPAQKKAKRFQCQHCQRFFARLEHLQRHERTRMIVADLCCCYASTDDVL
jgi:hypothetical protein